MPWGFERKTENLRDEGKDRRHVFIGDPVSDEHTAIRKDHSYSLWVVIPTINGVKPNSAKGAVGLEDLFHMHM